MARFTAPEGSGRTYRGNGRFDPSPQKGERSGRVPRGAFDDTQIYNLIYDLKLEPDWRTQAEIDSAFYDGDQINTETLRRMRELGMAPIVFNMIAPAIDATCGWEAFARAGLRVLPEVEDSYMMAQALNVKFAEALRLTNFNRAVSRAFRGCVTRGIDWIEVNRHPDPFRYPYRVTTVPWREIYVDYKSREADYSDARYVIRRKWFDTDVLKKHFPGKLQKIDDTTGGYRDGWMSEWEELGHTDHAASLAASLTQEERYTLEEDEWRYGHRDRKALYEILYSVPYEVEVLRLNHGVVVQLDRESPAQLEALRLGVAKYEKGVSETWRQAFYVGPHRMKDRELDLRRKHYIPMVAYRKDNDGSPYGIVRRMRSPQEAVNARHTRLLYDTSSRKYLVDDDAVDNHTETARELNKVNSYVQMRGDRVGEGIVALPATDSSPVTAELMEAAKRGVHEVSGLYPEFMGGMSSANASGVAIEERIEQTTKTLGVIVDNYRYAKTMAGEYLLQMILKDMQEMDDIEVETEEDSMGQRKTIVINARNADGTRTNDLLMARVRLALGEVPESATYQQQKFQSLVEIVKSMPPEMQVVMTDLVVRAASLPHSEEILERIRSMTGYGPEPKDPEKREALAQQQQQQQELQQQVQALELALQEAELAVKQAKAEADRARAVKLEGPDTDYTEAKIMTELAKAGGAEAEQARKNRETDAKLIESSAHLKKERNAERTAAAKPAAPSKS